MLTLHIERSLTRTYSLSSPMTPKSKLKISIVGNEQLLQFGNGKQLLKRGFWLDNERERERESIRELPSLIKV